MTPEASRAFLDGLEKHVLQPQFRYDHLHAPGDVTIWNNYMSLHNSPPIKIGIDRADDARLLYRLSCKGAPPSSCPATTIRPGSRAISPQATARRIPSSARRAEPPRGCFRDADGVPMDDA